MDRRGTGAQRRSFHGCSSRPEKRSRALPLKAERVGECQGGELNSRPTPNAFGAALVLQIINRELWILLSLQHFFDTARLRERRDLRARDKFKLFAQAFRCISVSSFVLSKSRI